MKAYNIMLSINKKNRTNIFLRFEKDSNSIQYSLFEQILTF